MEVGTSARAMTTPLFSAQRRTATATASSRASRSLGAAAPLRSQGFCGRQLGALSARPALPARPRRSLVAVQARRSSGGGPDVADRVVAALPYLLPLFDGERARVCGAVRS